MANLDPKLTREMQDWLNARPSDRDFMRGATMLRSLNRNKALYNTLVRNPGKERNGDDTIARYNDSDEWPVSQPVGMYFQYGLVDEFMQEWLLRQQELHAGQIMREEYFEWKLNWPHTCDDSKERKEYIPWKKK